MNSRGREAGDREHGRRLGGEVGSRDAGGGLMEAVGVTGLIWQGEMLDSSGGAVRDQQVELRLGRV